MLKRFIMKKKQILQDNTVIIDKKLNQYEADKLFPKKMEKINALITQVSLPDVTKV